MVIIDDNEIDLELLAHVVSDLTEVNVNKFQHASEALDFLINKNKTRIDLVLCDYEMPKYNGLDILIKFRKKNISVPFMFISAFNNDELTNLCKSEGATDLIVKPFVTHQLLTKIEKALNYQDVLQA
ncbi:response regulator [uncultured Paraglaciecola sp.]|mgnify:CR=1 FL=1|uniref:response regulator n=1 Tax=uncultured Paraglaciecola sp. TaxID=1765024 RepID=UPI0025E4A728|nr:response regulator [uncultured Paraglaciecola sp.]